MIHDALQVPWLEDHPSGVEWIFDRQRPELASRMIHKMDQSQVVLQSQESNSTKAPKAKAKAKAKARANGSLRCGVDSFRICADEVVAPCTKATGRIQTFVDVLMGSAVYVIQSIDRDFAQAATRNLKLGFSILTQWVKQNNRYSMSFVKSLSWGDDVR